MSGLQARNRLCLRKKVRGMIQLALSIATTTSKDSKFPFPRHYTGVRDGLAFEQGSRTRADPRGGSEHACNLTYHKDVANRKKAIAAHHLSTPHAPAFCFTPTGVREIGVRENVSFSMISNLSQKVRGLH